MKRILRTSVTVSRFEHSGRRDCRVIPNVLQTLHRLIPMAALTQMLLQERGDTVYKMDQHQRIEYPKLRLDSLHESKSQSKSDNIPFITEHFVHSIFHLLTLLDSVPSTDQSMDIYHHFLQLLSFVRHSNDNIDKNARFVSALFKLDFDAYRYKRLKTAFGSDSGIESEAKSNDSKFER